MSLSKFSNLYQIKTLYTSTFVIKEIKGQTFIFSKNFRKQSFLDGFHASENQNKRKIQTENKTHQDRNLKISSIQLSHCRVCSASKHHFTFKIHPLALEVYHGARDLSPLCYQRKRQKTGSIILCCSK